MGSGHLDRSPHLLAAAEVVGAGRGDRQAAVGGLRIGEHREVAALRILGDDEARAGEGALRGPEHGAGGVDGAIHERPVGLLGRQEDVPAALHGQIPRGFDGHELIELGRQAHVGGVGRGQMLRGCVGHTIEPLDLGGVLTLGHSVGCARGEGQGGGHGNRNDRWTAAESCAGPGGLRERAYIDRAAIDASDDPLLPSGRRKRPPACSGGHERTTVRG